MTDAKIYDAIETCAGAGGQAIGLHRAGFAHRALVEIDRHACATLRLNADRINAEGKIFEDDLTKWPRRPEVDSMMKPSLLAGGVPCPPFSMAGKQLGKDDERDLFPRMVSLTRKLKPRALLIENVRGLLDRKFDDYRAKIDRDLRKMGLHAHWQLIQASDFGVPQLRPRTIMVALSAADAEHFEFPDGSPRQLSVGDALRASMGSAGWEGAEDWAEGADQIAPTLVGGSKKHGGPDLGPTRAKRAWLELGVDGMGIANDVPQPGDDGMPRLTVEQAAIVQGFPTWWKISGKKTNAYRQVGNAFPPPVAEAVGKQIIAAFRAADGETAPAENLLDAVSI